LGQTLLLREKGDLRTIFQRRAKAHSFSTSTHFLRRPRRPIRWRRTIQIRPHNSFRICRLTEPVIPRKAKRPRDLPDRAALSRLPAADREGPIRREARAPPLRNRCNSTARVAAARSRVRMSQLDTKSFNANLTSVLTSVRKGEESDHQIFSREGFEGRKIFYVEARAHLFDWSAPLRLLRFQDPRSGPGDHRRHRRTGRGSRRRNPSGRQRDHPE